MVPAGDHSGHHGHVVLEVEVIFQRGPGRPVQPGPANGHVVAAVVVHQFAGIEDGVPGREVVVVMVFDDGGVQALAQFGASAAQCGGHTRWNCGGGQRSGQQVSWTDHGTGSGPSRDGTRGREHAGEALPVDVLRGIGYLHPRDGQGLVDDLIEGAVRGRLHLQHRLDLDVQARRLAGLESGPRSGDGPENDVERGAFGATGTAPDRVRPAHQPGGRWVERRPGIIARPEDVIPRRRILVRPVLGNSPAERRAQVVLRDRGWRGGPGAGERRVSPPVDDVAAPAER